MNRLRMPPRSVVLLGTVAIVALIAAIGSGSRSLELMSRIALVGAVVASALGGIQQQAAEAGASSAETRTATSAHMKRLLLFGLIGAIFAASIYDHFRFIRAVF